MMNAQGTAIEKIIIGDCSSNGRAERAIQETGNIIKTYKATIKSASAHQEDIKWKMTRATSDYKIRKLNNCKKFIEDLSGMISNPSIRNVLHYEINEWFLRTPIRYKYVPPILIRELWVRKLVLDILLVPSKVKKSTVERMAKVITREYAARYPLHTY